MSHDSATDAWVLGENLKPRKTRKSRNKRHARLFSLFVHFVSFVVNSKDSLARHRCEGDHFLALSFLPASAALGLGVAAGLGFQNSGPAATTASGGLLSSGR